MADERVETVGEFEMLWDCDHCEAKRLLGKSQRHCPQCGGVQNPDKRYFPKDGEFVAATGHDYEGADRVCASCQAPMGAKASNCTNCGAAMDGVKEVAGVAPPAPAPAKKGSSHIFLIVGVIVLVCVAIWWRCVRKVDATLAVSGHTWSTTVAIESWDDVEHKVWRNELPASVAAMASCAREERSKQQVPDGETCKDQKVDNKDGTFKVVKKCTPRTRAEPVYDDKCRYTIREWHRVDEAKASGTGTTLGWAANVPPAPKDLMNVMVGTRRPGAKGQKLDLVFGTQTCADVSESLWRKYKDGDKVKLEVRASSGDIVCSGL